METNGRTHYHGWLLITSHQCQQLSEFGSESVFSSDCFVLLIARQVCASLGYCRGRNVPVYLQYIKDGGNIIHYSARKRWLSLHREIVVLRGCGLPVVPPPRRCHPNFLCSSSSCLQPSPSTATSSYYPSLNHLHECQPAAQKRCDGGLGSRSQQPEL